MSEQEPSTYRPFVFAVIDTDRTGVFSGDAQRQLLTLTYQVVDTFIPEAGGVETIERLVSAKVGNESDQNWWKRVSKTSNVESLRKKYDAHVEKATIK